MNREPPKYGMPLFEVVAQIDGTYSVAFTINPSSPDVAAVVGLAQKNDPVPGVLSLPDKWLGFPFVSQTVRNRGLIRNWKHSKVSAGDSFSFSAIFSPIDPEAFKRYAERVARIADYKARRTLDDGSVRPTVPVWRTKEGEYIPINEMTDMHLENTIYMLERAAVRSNDVPDKRFTIYRDLLKEWDRRNALPKSSGDAMLPVKGERTCAYCGVIIGPYAGSGLCPRCFRFGKSFRDGLKYPILDSSSNPPDAADGHIRRPPSYEVF